MPAARRQQEPEPRYAMSELHALRRTMLRFARSLPPGPERNQRRQISRSLRKLFRDRDWLDRNTIEGAP